MPHAQGKPRSVGRTKAEITMFEITGDAAKVFADLRLPAVERRHRDCAEWSSAAEVNDRQAW